MNLPPFFLGLLISAGAGIPAIVISVLAPKKDFSRWIKFWSIGMAVRFLVIGAAAFKILSDGSANRVPFVLGIVTAFFVTFAIETLVYNLRR